MDILFVGWVLIILLENRIIKILTENNINYINIYFLIYRYDFYLPKYNRLIEFDGK